MNWTRTVIERLERDGTFHQVGGMTDSMQLDDIISNMPDASASVFVTFGEESASDSNLSCGVRQEVTYTLEAMMVFKPAFEGLPGEDEDAQLSFQQHLKAKLVGWVMPEFDDPIQYSDSTKRAAPSGVVIGIYTFFTSRQEAQQ